MSYNSLVTGDYMPRGNLATLRHFTPKWRSGATQVIRVPIALSDQVLAYARALDEGMSPDGDTNKEHLLQVIEALEEISQTPRNNFGQQPKAKLRKAIDTLKSLVTSEAKE